MYIEIKKAHAMLTNQKTSLLALRIYIFKQAKINAIAELGVGIFSEIITDILFGFLFITKNEYKYIVELWNKVIFTHANVIA